MYYLSSRLHMLFWTVLILTLGYAFGTYEFRVEQVEAPPNIIILNEDIHEFVPVVHLQKILNGDMVGIIDSPARFIISDHVVVPDDDGSFKLPANPFLVNIIDVQIPRGAKFVASSKGKKYYDVYTKSAERLSPANRIYFRTSKEAEAMGYRGG